MTAPRTAAEFDALRRSGSALSWLDSAPLERDARTPLRPIAEREALLEARFAELVAREERVRRCEHVAALLGPWGATLTPRQQLEAVRRVLGRVEGALAEQEAALRERAGMAREAA